MAGTWSATPRGWIVAGGCRLPWNLVDVDAGTSDGSGATGAVAAHTAIPMQHNPTSRGQAGCGRPARTARAVATALALGTRQGRSNGRPSAPCVRAVATPGAKRPKAVKNAHFDITS